MPPAAVACGLRMRCFASKTKMRSAPVCQVANVEAQVYTEQDRKGQTQGSKPVHHGAASPQVTIPSDQLDEVCGPLPTDLSAGEAEMAVKEPDVTTSVAAVTRSIVFVASEAAPFAKTGGLGDVCGSLPKALAKRGHRVMVVLPRYDAYEGASFTGVTVDLDGCEVGFHHQLVAGVDFVFVDHPSYQRPGGMYGDENGVYGDNQWRFKLLCQAALEAPLALELEEADNNRPSLMGDLNSSSEEADEKSDGGSEGSSANARVAALALARQNSEDAVAGRPVSDGRGERSVYGQDCIFVANDWFAGLVPIYLAARYRPGGIYLGARCIMLLHNLCHQGVYPPGTFELLGLPGSWYEALEWQYPPEQRQGAYEEEGRAINTLKGAITTADRIVAVSPGYAYEIQTGLGGFGMEWLLGSRQYALNGVLNGIDYTEWNPATDAHLPAKYSAQDLPALLGKARCKKEMQRELGLPERDDVPLLAFIGRLDSQKGADLILAASRWIVEQGAQIVCLGTGDPALEDGLRWMEGEFPDNARGWVGFNVPFSHRLTAAADILLMPSRFEPCGLNQLYAMHYGTIPVAHATGGLRDTVKTFDPYNPEGTTGWAFDEFTEDSFKGAIWNALETYRHDKDAWKGLQKRGMEMDFTWNHAAEQYEQIFEWSQMDLPYCG